MPLGYTAIPTNGLAPTSLDKAASATHVQQVVENINGMQQGRLNVILGVTLRASHTTTTIVDSRISMVNGLFLQPTSAHAAAAYVAGIWTSSQTSGSVVLNHPSSANTDQTFNLLIIG